MPLKHPIGIFPDAAFAEDQCTFITITNCLQVKDSILTCPGAKSDNTRSLQNIRWWRIAPYRSTWQYFKKSDLPTTVQLTCALCIVFLFSFNWSFLCYSVQRNTGLADLQESAVHSTVVAQTALGKVCWSSLLTFQIQRLVFTLKNKSFSKTPV